MRRFSILLAGGALAVAGTTTSGATASTTPAVAAPAAAATAKADFDGDGFSDLAVPVSGESAGSVDDAGAVHVLYGGPGGVTAGGDQVWSQDTAGIKGVAEYGERMASATTTGDFDGDGYADLAMGSPIASDDGGQGVVNVLYGSPSGLTAAGDQLWHRGVAGLGTSSYDFGAALAAGDFDGDGDDELAVGAPFDAGTVSVIPGSPAGLTSVGARVWDRDVPGIPGDAFEDDAFGARLDTGDFGRGDFDDLVVVVREEDNQGSLKDNGAAHVLYGSAGGLTTDGNQYWSQDSPGVLGISEPDELFGYATAAGNFGKTAEDDLAVSTALEAADGGARGGTVNVLYGSPEGLAAVGNQYWSQDSPGVTEVAEDGDLFGADLAAADFGRTGQADLAIAAPGETVGAVAQAGVVHVLHGSASGLTASGSQLWHRNRSGVLGANAATAWFGKSLFAADVGRSGRADLRVGVPGQRVGGNDGAGAVHLLYGGANGLTASGDQVWHQNSPGVLDAAEEFDSFG